MVRSEGPSFEPKNIKIVSSRGIGEGPWNTSVRGNVAEQLVLLSEVGPDIVRLVDNHLQEGEKLQQLLVIRVHEPRLNGNPILKLVTERLQYKPVVLISICIL